MAFDLSNLRNDEFSTVSTLVDCVYEPESDYLGSDEEFTQEEMDKLHKNILNRALEVEVEQAFSLFDRNRDNKIDFLECQAAFKALRLNPSADNLKVLFNDLGKDENQSLNLTDFKTLVLSKIHTRYTTSEIQKIFNQLQDGNGKITLDSLKSAVYKIGADISDDELSLMISGASECETYIPLDDFAKLLKRSWTGDPLDMIYDSDLVE